MSEDAWGFAAEFILQLVQEQCRLRSPTDVGSFAPIPFADFLLFVLGIRDGSLPSIKYLPL